MKKKKFNITKFLKLFLICLVIVPCVFTFSACKSKEAVYVVSIEKTKTDGLKDTTLEALLTQATSSDLH